MIKLILRLKETEIDEFNLEKSTINIGRSQENDIAIDNIQTIWDFTKQKTSEKLTFDEAQQRLIQEFYKG